MERRGNLPRLTPPFFSYPLTLPAKFFFERGNNRSMRLAQRRTKTLSTTQSRTKGPTCVVDKIFALRSSLFENPSLSSTGQAVPSYWFFPLSSSHPFSLAPSMWFLTGSLQTETFMVDAATETEKDIAAQPKAFTLFLRALRGLQLASTVTFLHSIRLRLSGYRRYR